MLICAPDERPVSALKPEVLDAEFLHRVQRRAQHAGEGVAADLIVVVQAVEGGVVLIGARAQRAAAAAVVTLIVMQADTELRAAG